MSAGGRAGWRFPNADDRRVFPTRVRLAAQGQKTSHRKGADGRSAVAS